MQFTFNLLALAACAATVAADATIQFCNTQSCDGNCNTQTVPGDGTCRELGGISSAFTEFVDAGCSVTVYTDSTCSVGATTAGQGACVEASTLSSFSYDC